MKTKQNTSIPCFDKNYTDGKKIYKPKRSERSRQHIKRVHEVDIGNLRKEDEPASKTLHKTAGKKQKTYIWAADPKNTSNSPIRNRTSRQR